MSDRAPGHAEEDDEPGDPGDMDPDLLLFTDYLTNLLSPRERARVDDRLTHDPEFAKWAEPLMYVWRMPLLPSEQQVLDKLAAEELARDPHAPSPLWSGEPEGRLPKTYSACYAQEILTDLALSSDVTHRRETVQAICLSARDVSNARLRRDVIRAECAAGRLPVVIADFLVIHCADFALDRSRTIRIAGIR